MPFGIDPKEITWVVASLKWVMATLRAIATKLGVDTEEPPNAY